MGQHGHAAAPRRPRTGIIGVLLVAVVASMLGAVVGPVAPAVAASPACDGMDLEAGMTATELRTSTNNIASLRALGNAVVDARGCAPYTGGLTPAFGTSASQAIANGLFTPTVNSGGAPQPGVDGTAVVSYSSTAQVITNQFGVDIVARPLLTNDTPAFALSLDVQVRTGSTRPSVAKLVDDGLCALGANNCTFRLTSWAPNAAALMSGATELLVRVPWQFVGNSALDANPLSARWGSMQDAYAVIGLAPLPPIANLQVTSTAVGTNEWRFDASASAAFGTAQITDYEFTFGDGQTASGTDASVVHAYTGDRSPTATVTVTDSFGSTDTESVTLDPELRVNRVTRDPDRAHVGAPFALEVELENGGASTLRDVGVDASFVPTSVATRSEPTEPPTLDLPPGATEIVRMPIDVLERVDGASAHISATGTSFTDAIITATPRDVDLPTDAFVVELSTDPLHPEPDESFMLRAHVTNDTADELRAVTPALTVDPASGAVISAPTPTVHPVLTAGDSFDFTWTLSLPERDATLTVEVDAVTGTGDPRTTSGELEIELGSAIIVNDNGDAGINPDALVDRRCDTNADENDDDVCTLRAAIQLANAQATSASIQFDIPGDGVPRILVLSELPAINVPVDIDGRTQAAGRVEISGLGVEPATPNDLVAGLQLAGAESTLRGLAVNGFEAGSGITVSAPRVTITDAWAGLRADGHTAAPNAIGIDIRNGASDLQIGGNDGGAGCRDCVVASGNLYDGIRIDALGISGIRITGSMIGPDVTGTQVVTVPNDVTDNDGQTPQHHQWRGIFNVAVAQDMVVGGAAGTPGAGVGNVISGNFVGIHDITVQREGPEREQTLSVSGNLIGTDITGTRALEPGFGTGFNGVLSGGSTETYRNVISGLALGTVFGWNTHDLIGLDRTGSHAIPNTTGVHSGIVEDSVISGNDVGVAYSSVVGSLIGLAPDGVTPIGNRIGAEKMSQVGGTRGTGTDCDGDCNVIAGNTIGVRNSRLIVGNNIGVLADGVTAVPNGVGIDGVVGTVGGISQAGNGGQCNQYCNVIAGNAGAAIDLNGRSFGGALWASPEDDFDGVVRINGNVIGRDIDGAELANGAGVLITGTLTSPMDVTRIEIGRAPGAGNVIDGGNEPAIDTLTDVFGLEPLRIENNWFSGRAPGPIASAASVTPVAPVITSASIADGRVHVTGHAGTFTGSSSFELSLRPDCAGVAVPVATLGEVAPNTTFEFDVPVANLPPVAPVASVLRTDLSLRTSTFSNCADLGLGRTVTTADAAVGATVVEVASNDGFSPGDYVELRPDGVAPIVRHVDALGSLIFDAPLPIDIPTGTEVVRVDAPPGEDTTAPVITVTNPTAGVSITKGAVVAVVASCSDGSGVGVEGCSFPTALDTATVGAKTLTVKAWDSNGNAATKTVAYKVVDPTPPPSKPTVTLTANPTSPRPGRFVVLTAQANGSHDQHDRVLIRDVGTGRVVRTCESDRCSVPVWRLLGSVKYRAELQIVPRRGHPYVVATSKRVTVTWAWHRSHS